MPVKSFIVGPGTLTVGAVPLDITAQVTAMRVDWAENVTAGDVIPLLDDTELVDPDVVTYRATLAGNLVQDITAAGLVEWSWTNKGTKQPVTFIPSTAAGREVTGTIVPVPITIGGDLKKSGRSDIAWRFVGDPVLGTVI